MPDCVEAGPASWAGGDPRPRPVVRWQELVRLDSKPRAVELPVGKQPGSLLQALNQPGLVEPNRLCRARLVRHRRLDDHQASTAGPSQANRAHLDLDRRLFADRELRQLARLRAIPVGVRDVQQQLAERLDPELGRRVRQPGAGAAKRGHRGVQHARTRRRSERRRSQPPAVLRLVCAEGDRRRGLRCAPGAAQARAAASSWSLSCPVGLVFWLKRNASR